MILFVGGLNATVINFSLLKTELCSLIHEFKVSCKHVPCSPKNIIHRLPKSKNIQKL